MAKIAMFPPIFANTCFTIALLPYVAIFLKGISFDFSHEYFVGLSWKDLDHTSKTGIKLMRPVTAVLLFSNEPNGYFIGFIY